MTLRKKGTDLLRSTLSLSAGTAIAQLITVIFIPFIARIYGPEGYGAQGVMISIVTIVAPVSGLSYPLAIVLPKNNNAALAVDTSALIFSFALSAISASVIAALFILHVEYVYNNILYTAMIPLVIFASYLQQSTLHWLLRLGALKGISASNVFHATIVNSIKLVGGIFLPISAFLVFVTALSPAIHAAIQAAFLPVRSSRIKALKEKRSQICYSLVRYRDFPLFKAPEALMTAASEALPVIVIAGYFGATPAGFYALCRSALAFPMRMIGISLEQATFRSFNLEKDNSSALFRLYAAATSVLIAPAILTIILAYTASRPVIELVLGEQWAGAEVYAQWISIWMAIMLVSRPAFSLLYVLERQIVLLIYGASTLATRVISLILGVVLLKGPEDTVMLFSTLGSLTTVALIFSAGFFTLKKSRGR